MASVFSKGEEMYKLCKYGCGAKLDPQESCDCRDNQNKFNKKENPPDEHDKCIPMPSEIKQRLESILAKTQH